MDADATERFTREGFFDEGENESMVLSVPPDADEADLALTQPLPKVEVDEDLIRTHELPIADDEWMQEMLESDEREGPRSRARIGREPTGQFPHPARAPRPSPPKRSSSLDASTALEADEKIARRIHKAYREYLALCQEHVQPVVGEETFAKRLRGRLAKLVERHPRDKILFRAVIEEGVVRVRGTARSETQVAIRLAELRREADGQCQLGKLLSLWCSPSLLRHGHSNASRLGTHVAASPLMTQRTRRRASRGVTLIEVLIVVAILSLLAAGGCCGSDASVRGRRRNDHTQQRDEHTRLRKRLASDPCRRVSRYESAHQRRSD